MSDRDIEQEFEDIIQKAVDDMAAVDCPQAEYLSALKSARSRFYDLVRMVEQEMAQ